MREAGWSFVQTGPHRLKPGLDSLPCCPVVSAQDLCPPGAASIAVALLLLAGCGPPPPPPPLDTTGAKLILDVDGHSLAAGEGANKPGPGGSGYAPQVADALDAKENNNAVSGATLQESGMKSDGWGVVLDNYPRKAGDTAAEDPPRVALLNYGANDLGFLGADLTLAEEAYRTIISRHRATAVYEAGPDAEPTIVADSSWEPDKTGAAEASGDGVLRSKAGGSITLNIPKGAVPPGGTVALGFTQAPKTAASYEITVDGKAADGMDTHGPRMPEFFSLGYVFRIEDLSDGPHTIEIEATNVIGQAGFDYWQVEPARPQPVVLVKQYLLPDYSGFSGFPYTPGDKDFIALNRMTDSLAKEFGPDVLTVDTEKAIHGSPDLLGSDSIHPNQAGYDAIAEAILDAMASPKAPKALREALRK